MRLTLDDLAAISPDYLWLELSNQEQEDIWRIVAQQRYSNPAARWNGYLNLLCLNRFLRWLKDEFKAELPLQATADSSIWDLVNGTVLTMGQARIVLIPDEQSNSSEVCIPQEWVDIDTWAPDYYLAMQLNLEDCWLRVRGYTTRAQILDRAYYEAFSQTYALSADDLVSNLNVMWVAQEICPPPKPDAQSLLSLLPSRADLLIKQLSRTTAYSPRGEIPFPEWAAILASDDYREQLYQLRLENCKNPGLESNPGAVRHDLSQWLQKTFTAEWQSLESLLNSEQRDLAFNLRSYSLSNNGIEITGFKILDLGLQLGETNVVLLIGLEQSVGEAVCIRVRLCPTTKEACLPANIDLVLLNESETALQTVRSRHHDVYIQLKRFRPSDGIKFSIQISLGEVSLKENFVFKAE